MKHIFLLLFLLTIACEQRSSHFPDFEATRSLKYVDELVYSQIKEKEFSLIFYTSLDGTDIKRKILSFSNKKWEKMEIRKDMYANDFMNTDVKLSNSYNTVIVRKECDSLEENEIWNNLKN